MRVRVFDFYVCVKEQAASHDEYIHQLLGQGFEVGVFMCVRERVFCVGVCVKRTCGES